jgi:hypothetical protein
MFFSLLSFPCILYWMIDLSLNRNVKKRFSVSNLLVCQRFGFGCFSCLRMHLLLGTSLDFLIDRSEKSLRVERGNSLFTMISIKQYDGLLQTGIQLLL